MLSTVNVKTGANQPTIHQLADVLDGIEAIDRTLERVVQAGAQPTSWVQVLCELQRDWSRKETAGKFAEILFAVEGH